MPSLSDASSWWLYILACSDGSYYTGITNNLTRRIARHNSGAASRYTRCRLPVSLVYHEKCVDRSDALRKEYAMKRRSRRGKEAYMELHGRGVDSSGRNFSHE